MVSLKVRDLPFLLDEAARFTNQVDTGQRKTNSFVMRQEQKDCLLQTYTFFKDPANAGRDFLWDCKMRFGKTHTAYVLLKALDAKLTLILTGRPTDTKQSWIDAMDHTDFDFGAKNFVEAAKWTIPIDLTTAERKIVFASTQDFAHLIEGSFKEKFAQFSTTPFDLVIGDEIHLNFDTDKTKHALSMLTYKHMLRLSGTPFRALLEERFADDAKFTWSYLNEQAVRTKEIDTLGLEAAQQDGYYYWLCPMKVFTILLSPDIYQDAELFVEDEGFTFTKLFATEAKGERTVFRNDTAVASFLNCLSSGLVMPFSNQSQNHHIDATNLRHTLWYVPGVPEAEMLAAKLRKHPIFKYYEIVVAAGDNEAKMHDAVQLVKNRIADVESGRSNKKGTITLSCGKLSHGVSIPEWGAVLNLSDIKSAQLYFQLNFRVQTPWETVKHECYVFDFNPNRTLEHMFKLAQVSMGDKIRSHT